MKGRNYRKVRNRETGRRRRAHRVAAEQLLGRALLPGEVVHHLDGDPGNNAPENLLVLPSQALHASIEYHLRRAKGGMPSLFPGLLTGEGRLSPEGSLFQSLLLPGRD